MLRTLIASFFTFIFYLIMTTGTLQAKEIRIEFIGNCGLHMTDGSSNIYIDFPYKSGAFGYMDFDDTRLDNVKENAIFIFTHKHADHYSKKNLKKVMKVKGGKKIGVSNISELEKLSEIIDDFEIEAFKTKHTFFGIPFRHYSYLITWHGKRIFISGDTTNPETIGKIKNIDLAFIPYWLYENAEAQNIEIDANEIGIYHLYPSEMEPVKAAFKDKKGKYPLTESGETITLKI